MLGLSPTPDSAPSRPRLIRWLSTLGEGVRIAFDTLNANRVRSALTILGVAVGVSVVVTLAALITGIRSEVMMAFEAAGPSNFTVLRFDFTAAQVDDGGRPSWLDRPVITPREAERLAGLPAVDEALYVLDATVAVAFEGERVEGVMARGSSAGWPRYQLGEFTAGRNFTDPEVRSGRSIVVISAPLAEELFGLRDPIGRSVRLSAPGRSVLEDFTVVGVFEAQENVFSAAMRYWAVVPYTASIKRLRASDQQAAVYVVPHGWASQLVAQDQVTTALRSMRGLRPRDDNDFALIASEQILSLFNRFTGVFFLVMLALSSAGLLVGGVGVIGIMLISVTERTHEIGVRKAIGATRSEILWQFLVEAACLTVLGGATGMLMGAALAFGVAELTPIPARIPLWSVGAALGMALVTGILFGLLPAYRAAHLDPVAALRAE